jgi:hypothetical protein
VDLQGSRIEDDHRRLIESPRGRGEREQGLQHLQIDIHFLLIAIGYLLRCLRTCAEVLDDETIRAIHEDFDRRAPYIKHFRDVLEHLDEYVSGRGRLVREGELPRGSNPVLVFEPLSGEIVVWLGSWKLPVRALSRVGAELGKRLSAAWEEQFGPDEDLTVWGRSS